MPDRESRANLLLPVAAFLAILPLILQGCSCGHDFDFHILSWMEAARQFTQGNLHPHWAYTPAFNAGEPRFLFYPPLSWAIGATLGLIMPWTWTPIVYTWLALTAAGLSLYHLAKSFATPQAALLAATFYIVNPYMLFTAYERTAYAELLAAAWIPLLLHALLRDKITIPRIAIPVALLWLTNAPAAVMSCYALALLTLIRLLTTYRSTKNPGAPQPALSLSKGPDFRTWVSRHRAIHLQPALNTTAGTALGLGLAAFYILPAAYERRYVQIAMAILPNMSIHDNFLFRHTSNALHDAVLHTASLIALTLILLTAAALTYLRLHKPLSQSATNPRVPHPSQLHREGWVPRMSLKRNLLLPLAILTLTITLLLTPLSTPIWNHTPELLFLQFPWRLLAILAAVLSLTLALTLTPITRKPTTAMVLTIAIAAALTYPAYHLFHQPCDEEDTVAARLTLFHSNEGADPTDEYTPLTADNDVLAHTNPAYWLAGDPATPAPTTDNPAPAPSHLALTLPTPQTLILNLRDYPTWRITRNQTLISTRQQRDDGLIAIPLPAGASDISITYAQPTDQTLGDILTAISLILLLLTLHKSNPAPRT